MPGVGYLIPLTFEFCVCVYVKAKNYSSLNKLKFFQHFIFAQLIFTTLNHNKLALRKPKNIMS